MKHQKQFKTALVFLYYALLLVQKTRSTLEPINEDQKVKPKMA